MSSQRSGSGQSFSRRERQSMLEGVYEENVRTQQGQPAPRGEESAEEDTSRGVPRWAVALFAVMVLAAAGAATYWAGGPQHLQERLARGGQKSATAESIVPLTLPDLTSRARGAAPETAVPAGDSLRGRTMPFKLPPRRPAGIVGSASLLASSLFAPVAAEERPRALPLASQDSLSVAGVFGLAVKTVVIDPGHGGKKDGAIGPGGTKEKHVALDVARRLRRRLERRYDYRVLMTRTGDQHRSLRERVAFANRHHADLFISIHVNSLPVERVTSIETYYYGAQAGDQVLRLARRENRASDYSVAEFNELLEEVGQTMRRQESKRLAASIQKNLYRNIKEINGKVRNWGVKTAPFVVLLGAEAPSVLAEIAVISNRKEEQELRNAAYREKLARFLEEGIAAYLGTAAPKGERLAAGPASP